jgi:hypothetical protein
MTDDALTCVCSRELRSSRQPLKRIQARAHSNTIEGRARKFVNSLCRKISNLLYAILLRNFLKICHDALSN